MRKQKYDPNKKPKKIKRAKPTIEKAKKDIFKLNWDILQNEITKTYGSMTEEEKQITDQFVKLFTEEVAKIFGLPIEVLFGKQTAEIKNG